MKTVTLNVDGISQGQWSTFLLELNLSFCRLVRCELPSGRLGALNSLAVLGHLKWALEP